MSGDSEIPILDIKYTCLYVDYTKGETEWDAILEFMNIVEENALQFIKYGENDICDMLFIKERLVQNKELLVFSPTIIIRSGPDVVGFVDIDTTTHENKKYGIVQHICSKKGYGSIALAIAEDVMLTPSEVLMNYYSGRLQDTYVHIPPFAITLEDVIPKRNQNGFYQKCGYTKVTNDKRSKEMEKIIKTGYANTLTDFLKTEEIFYEGIEKFRTMIDRGNDETINIDTSKKVHEYRKILNEYST
jgi:hypothetical protein